jgi:hypothetical protein
MQQHNTNRERNEEIQNAIIFQYFPITSVNDERFFMHKLILTNKGYKLAPQGVKKSDTLQANHSTEEIMRMLVQIITTLVHYICLHII